MRNELIEKYIDFEKNINNIRTGKSILRYRAKKLLVYLEDECTDIFETGIREAKGFIVWLKEQDYKKSMIVNFLKTASGFFKYLKKQGKIIENPFDYVKRIKAGKSLPKGVLKEEEMEKLLNHLLCFESKKHTRKEKRNYCTHVIAELLYSTGIRANEAAGIKEEDIDFINGTIKINDTKSGKRRTVFLNDYAKEVLWMYVKEVRSNYMYGSNTEKNFFGMGCNRLITFLNEDLKEACKKTGLPVITSHSFRHSVGYQLLKAGCDIRYIQEILGHRNIRNTEIYTRIDNDDLRVVVEKCHPRKFECRK